MRVYVPIVSHDQSLLPTLKLSINGQKWRSGKSLPEIQLPKVTVSETKNLTTCVIRIIH